MNFNNIPPYPRAIQALGRACKEDGYERGFDLRADMTVYCGEEKPDTVVQTLKKALRKYFTITTGKEDVSITVRVVEDEAKGVHRDQVFKLKEKKVNG